MTICSLLKPFQDWNEGNSDYVANAFVTMPMWHRHPRRCSPSADLSGGGQWSHLCTLKQKPEDDRQFRGSLGQSRNLGNNFQITRHE